MNFASLVNPSNIVRYKCNDNIEIAAVDEDERKIQAMDQAKIIYLLFNHSSKTPEIFKSHCDFHKKIIEEIYVKGDIILVEEDSGKHSSELHHNLMPSLKASNYRTLGWVDPEFCEKSKSFYALEDKIKKAIQEIAFPKKQTDILAWNVLHNYLSGQDQPSENTLTNNLPSNIELRKLEAKKETFIFKCKIALKKSKIDFIYDNFAEAQDSLSRNTEKHLDLCIDQSKKIIVLMGRNHGNPSDEQLIPTVNSYFSNQRVPYVVIDPLT